MKIILSLFLLLIGLACNENDSQSASLPQTKVNDSLKFVELLGLNDVKSTALIVQQDTVFILIPSHFDETKYEFVRNFFYDTAGRVFHFNYNARRNSDSKPIDLKSFLNGSEVYLKSLSKTEIKYPRLPDKFKENEQLRPVLQDESKVQIYKGTYYFINSHSALEMKAYDPTRNELKSFPFNFIFLDVTDFFVHDIDGDDMPEFIIFHKGEIPRKEIMSYSIYSLRKDSVNVINK